MAHVELRRVSKVYGEVATALCEVDLDVRDGELLVLVGPNGSGKTTILRLIAGLERPTSGEIFVGGRLADGLSPKQRDVAMLFQGCVLYPHLNVERNIGFGLHPGFGGWNEKIRNWLARRFSGVDCEANQQSNRERVRQTAQLLGVEHLLDRFPRQLSGGERQRVALSRALVRQPAVFLLDEPSSQADVRWRQRMRRELKELKTQMPGAMIVVTHDHVEAIALADRLVVMNEGRVHQVGTPAEIAGQPRTRFVAEFFGHPPMNFVSGMAKADGGMVWFESSHGRVEVPGMTARLARFEMESMPNGREVWLGFRPDDAELRTEREVAVTESLTTLRAEATVTAETTLEELPYTMLRPVGTMPWDEEQEHHLLSVRAATNETEALRTGEQVTVVIDPNRCHLFDRRTGVNLMELK